MTSIGNTEISSLTKSGKRRIWRWRPLCSLKESATSRAAKSLLGTLTSSFAFTFLTVVQGALLARILGPRSRGEYSTVVIYTYFAAGLCLPLTTRSIIRQAAQHRGDPASVERPAIMAALIVGIASTIAALLLAAIAIPYEKRYLVPLAMLYSALLIVEHVRQTLLAVDQGNGLFLRFNCLRILPAILYVLGLLVLWTFGVRSLYIATTLIIPASLVGLLVRWPMCKDLKHFRAAYPAAKAMLRQGIPYGVSSLAATILAKVDQVLMVWLCDLTTQGYYAIAPAVGSVLQIATGAVGIHAFNRGAHNTSMAGSRSAVLPILYLIAGQAFACSAVALLLRPLLTLVYGPEFADAAGLTRALLPGACLAGIAHVFESYLQGRGKPMEGVKSRMVGALVAVLFVAFTFKHMGPISVPLGASCGSFFNCAVLLRMTLREHGLPQRSPGCSTGHN